MGNINVTTLLALLAIHYIADFVLQTSWQAENKWQDGEALLRHTAVYSLCFLIWGPTFASITFVLHTAIDFVTSKASHHFAEKKAWHNFFVVVGFDQFLHALQLTVTYVALRP